MRRLKMKAFRAGLGLSQQQMADKLGCSRGRYAGIEAGKRNGDQNFWLNFQKVFNISDSEVWEFMTQKEGEKNVRG
ncbi:MAG: helix-turn-helix transcriptional regulator [Prevotella sp.]|nr:helix-turn-helix transcriptional regulator [Prevotella sp.]